ncbi:NADH dehydrogenase [ubiquinone] 1 beta subcomplex subunit 8, mitochondrial [Physeter macrocephalus]|uniref:NADH dehydrogenase [ubiquinone] 1 beta subcomplex subunit 8, mitochondrial n=1 Tax=Physeter macrocephalus TaxID=9755 RepID=A0A2Y9EH19_PHYMC|nr:NADH dehydrogenase [ubiquinone] 1 beta subcomplex subunit 8, mitochondrial [Physeter catodon]|eukprot:XP_007101615.1 NADH dehydrogenase [ubiquinone] 1 beta subcomplex subunit 8, mitochondrial [Physeter catodon]
MAAARAGVLGVRWLQGASRNVVPMGARTASRITKDMLPGPYPRTPEERAAAAKKYNMRVEDYEPYPDDGMGYGDYPKLPDRSQQERDPWYDWDHPDLRLNWGEPMHWDLDMYIRNRVDTSPTPVSWNLMCKHLFGFVAFMLFMFWVGETYPTYQPVGPKQYPYNNLYLERGGDPNKEPESVVHYEI